jgi:hypothetical protein
MMQVGSVSTVIQKPTATPRGTDAKVVTVTTVGPWQVAAIRESAQ